MLIFFSHFANSLVSFSVCIQTKKFKSITFYDDGDYNHTIDHIRMKRWTIIIINKCCIYTASISGLSSLGWSLMDLSSSSSSLFSLSFDRFVFFLFVFFFLKGIYNSYFGRCCCCRYIMMTNSIGFDLKK